jgi:hypothetical protein
MSSSHLGTQESRFTPLLLLLSVRPLNAPAADMPSRRLCVYISIYIHIYIQTHINIYIYKYMNPKPMTYMYTHTHSHTHVWREDMCGTESTVFQHAFEATVCVRGEGMEGRVRRAGIKGKREERCKGNKVYDMKYICI